MSILFILSLVLNLNALDEAVSKKENISFSPSSNEFSKRQQEWIMSWKYRRGPNLIYDCLKRHFACVNNNNFERCKEERVESFRSNHSVLSCAPLRTFEFIDQCEEEQKKLVNQIPNKNFCINHRKKIIN
jgi:hypothetical protein